jgi:hypothetical protein
MNLMLQIAATLVAIAHHVGTPNLKMTQDPTLMALTMDLEEFKHYNGDGLYNAVSLDKQDKKLGKITWKYGGNGTSINIGVNEGSYCRKVVLECEKGRDDCSGAKPLLPFN